MADYGLIVKNNSNEIQIDSLYKNYTLLQSSSTSISGGIVTIDTQDTTSVPIFASKADATYCHCLYGFNKSGSSFISAIVYSEGSHTIYWKLFKGDYTATLPTYGLIIKNSSNQIVFSSEDTWLKIVNVYSRSTSYTDGWIDITVSDADNNYFIITDFSWTLFTYGGPPIYSWARSARGFRKTGSTTIRVEQFVYAGGTIPVEIEDRAWTDAFLLIELTT